MFGERYAFVIHFITFLHFSGILCNLMKYDTACPLKVVNCYNVDILYLSIGIFSLNRMVLFSST
jgi:hypothetical protein